LLQILPAAGKWSTAGCREVSHSPLQDNRHGIVA
jgi:hypothetical protein